MKHSDDGYSYNSTLSHILVEYASAVSSLNHVLHVVCFVKNSSIKFPNTKLPILLATTVFVVETSFCVILERSIYEFPCLNEYSGVYF
jgi:hypothetical protein